jgi:radical SAM protein (TIGR04043 family)
MNSEELLRLKVRLLTEGATLPSGYSRGRKGGAGPIGGRYFALPNGRSCGIPIRDGERAKQFHSSTLEPTGVQGEWIYDSKFTLTEIQPPPFYGSSTSEGMEFSKIALMHGSDCLATTVLQTCKYWNSGEQCKFCTIPTSYLSGNTIKEKTPDQLAEVVKIAEVSGRIKHILLTTGTDEGEDMGISRLIAISRAIRRVSGLPIAVQFEPPKNLSIFQELADAGVNAVGIHIESVDDGIRQEICPGKYTHSVAGLYDEAWDTALKYFGKGNVTTFILHGLGEDLSATLEFCDNVAGRGILPIVTPFRPAPGSQLADFMPSYVGNLEESTEFYKQLGLILYKHGLNPKATSGGCSRCGGCTPIQEAYDWAASQ